MNICVKTDLKMYERFYCSRLIELLLRIAVLESILVCWSLGFRTETTFNGTQHIAYPIPSHEMGSTSDRIRLSFKTSEPYGVLLYSGGTQGDFVALEIIRGKLR